MQSFWIKVFFLNGSAYLNINYSCKLIHFSFCLLQKKSNKGVFIFFLWTILVLVTLLSELNHVLVSFHVHPNECEFAMSASFISPLSIFLQSHRANLIGRVCYINPKHRTHTAHTITTIVTLGRQPHAQSHIIKGEVWRINEFRTVVGDTCWLFDGSRVACKIMWWG